jgi:riboflavin kinase/FMN adenylyltransferase
MRILRGLPSFPPELRPTVVALGAFDGIHLAHAKIIGTAVARGRDLGMTSVVCTFDPHPVAVLRPDRRPSFIATPEENLARIGDCGPDVAVVIPFTVELSRMEAEDFVERVLVGALGAREVVVGYNHTFGRGARGTATLLRELGERLHFAARVLPPLQVGGQTVSSSAIREALRDGDVQTAAALLGRPYAVAGTVRRGAGRGRTLGFATANLGPDRPLLLAPGVYTCRVTWDEQRGDGVVNVGYRPTFGEDQYWVEAHIFDFAGDLYDRNVIVEFLQRIRPEQAFASVEALVQQVTDDIRTARRLLRRAP